MIPAKVTEITLGARLLLVVAFLGAFFGVASLSNATMGVGILCGCCLLVMVARINQAAVHHRELMANRQ